MRVQVLGLCRFSYLTNLNGFQTVGRTMQEHRAALYDPVRLAERMMWFEHVTLPGIKTQGDSDFKLILLLGEDFPEPFRSRLLDLVQPVAQIVPVFRAVGDLKSTCNEVMQAARDPKADWVAEFRMDDDDAVAIDFVGQCRGKARWLRPMLTAQNRAALDFQRGMVARTEPDGVSYIPLVTTYWVPAMALYFKPDDPSSLLDYPHNKLWWRMPTLTLSDRFMFVRGAHGSNDSTVGLKKSVLLPTDPAGVPALLRDRFGIDTAAFAQAWAELRTTAA